MDKRDPGLAGLYEQLADRFKALSRLFGELSTPVAAQALLDSLMSDDPAAFNKLADGIDLPMLGKCFWINGVLERVFETPSRLVTGDCWLRDDLTPAERKLALQIAMRHRRRFGEATESNKGVLRDGHRVIPPGPFLDELRANGLTHCEESWAHDTSLAEALGPPERICI